MREPVYKIGDVLEFTEIIPKQFGLLARPVRGLVVKIDDIAYEYISYTLLLSGTVGTTKNMRLSCAFEKNIIPAAKRIGHINISALMFMENDDPDYQTMMMAATIMHSADLGNELDKVKEENEKLKTNNKELREALSDSEKKAHSRVDRIVSLMHKVDDLESENDSLRQALHNDLTRIHENLGKMGFMEDAIYSIIYSEPNDI